MVGKRCKFDGPWNSEPELSITLCSIYTNNNNDTILGGDKGKPQYYIYSLSPRSNFCCVKLTLLIAWFKSVVYRPFFVSKRLFWSFFNNESAPLLWSCHNLFSSWKFEWFFPERYFQVLIFFSLELSSPKQTKRQNVQSSKGTFSYSKQIRQSSTFLVSKTSSV